MTFCNAKIRQSQRITKYFHFFLLHASKKALPVRFFFFAFAGETAVSKWHIPHLSKRQGSAFVFKKHSFGIWKAML